MLQTIHDTAAAGPGRSHWAHRPASSNTTAGNAGSSVAKPWYRVTVGAHDGFQAGAIVLTDWPTPMGVQALLLLLLLLLLQLRESLLWA
jgi:hypothetical protein